MRTKDPKTGRVVRNDLREPPSELLDCLRFIARASVRRVYNDPRVTVFVERKVLQWLLDWDPVQDQPVRQHIGLKAGNEARRLKAMKPAERTLALSRAYRLPRLVHGDDWTRLSDQIGVRVGIRTE